MCGFPFILFEKFGQLPFLAWGDFHAPSRFARSTIPEEKWGTTRSLRQYGVTTTLILSPEFFV